MTTEDYLRYLVALRKIEKLRAAAQFDRTSAVEDWEAEQEAGRLYAQAIKRAQKHGVCVKDIQDAHHCLPTAEPYRP